MTPGIFDAKHRFNPEEIRDAQESEAIFIEVDPAKQVLCRDPIEIRDQFGFVFRNHPEQRAYVSLLDEPDREDDISFEIICERVDGRMFRGSIYAALANGYLIVEERWRSKTMTNEINMEEFRQRKEVEKRKKEEANAIPIILENIQHLLKEQAHDE